MSASAREVAERYFDAWIGGDLDTARSLLHDDLSFKGPIDTFDNAEDYSGAIRQLAPIVQGARKRHVFADGEDVCIVYDLITAPVPETRCVDWLHVRGEKIGSLEVFFDPRPFVAMSEHQG